MADVGSTRPRRWTGQRTSNSYKDKNNIGTGFTWLDRPSNGTGYIPENLDVDTRQAEGHDDGRHRVADTNSQDNALGVGIDAPSQTRS